MQSETQSGPVSKTMLWTGRAMSAIVALLVAFGSVVKLIKVAGVVEGMARTGYSEHLVRPVGVIELICVVVYLIPQTEVLGAILLTGLLGAAASTTFRIGDHSFPLPIVLGMMAWGGLFLRDVRLRALIPLVRK